MLLQDVLTQLNVGELSQIHIGGGEVGEIKEDDYPKIIPHISLGLTALYKRFTLKEGTVRIQLQTNKLTYSLDPKYAVSNARSRIPALDRHILDTALEPFHQDVLKVEKVYTDTGRELPLNDESESYSVSTPSMQTVRVPAVLLVANTTYPEWNTSSLDILYRANHKVLSIGTSGFIDPERTELELPETYLEPLLLFVASRIHNPIGLVNEFNAGNNYAAKYEQACALLERDNLDIDPMAGNHRLQARGWV